MTDTLLDYSPEDTGDIPALVGETARIITPADRERLLGEDTRNLAHDIAGLPPRRRPDALDTPTVLIDMPIGMVGLQGPQAPPPPLPKPPRPAAPGKYTDPAETGVGIFGGLGEDLPELEPDEDGDDVVFRRGCGGGQPWPQVADRKPATLRARWRRGRHVAPVPFWTAFLIGAGVTMAAYSGVVLAAVAVIR